MLICRAATYGEQDRVTGVSENIMLGRLAKVGTGAFDLFLDEDQLWEGMQQEDLAPQPITAPAPPPLFTPAFRSPLTFAFSPLHGLGDTNTYSPSSPSYAPQYSAQSPAYSPPEYNVMTPTYVPTSPEYNPAGSSSQVYDPAHPGIDFKIGFDDEYDPDKLDIDEYQPK